MGYVKMKFNEFRTHYNDAIETSTLELYIAEPGWESWMDNLDVDTIVKTMTTIYELSRANMEITELRKIVGFSRAEFSRLLGIPLRTLENWDSGVRSINDYTFYMIAYILFNKMMEDSNDNA